MEEQHIPYEPARKLRDLDFNEPCTAIFLNKEFTRVVKRESEVNSEIEETWDLNYKRKGVSLEDLYLNSCTAPTWQQAFDWFKENKLLEGLVEFDITDEDGDWIYTYTIRDYKERKTYHGDGIVEFEQARFACLEKLIEVVSTIKAESKIS